MAKKKMPKTLPWMVKAGADGEVNPATEKAKTKKKKSKKGGR